MPSSHSTRSKKGSADKSSSMVLPLKKALSSKTKKKPLVEEVVVEETLAPPPKPSQSDLARTKLAAGEVAEVNRLKDLAELEAAAKDLEDCVLKETKVDRHERRKRSCSRSRSRSPG